MKSSKPEKPKVDKAAEEARKAEAARLAREAEQERLRTARLDDQAKRRGAGAAAFIKTGESGLLKDYLGV